VRCRPFARAKIDHPILPGAYAPGFMLKPASQATRLFVAKPMSIAHDGLSRQVCGSPAFHPFSLH